MIIVPLVNTMADAPLVQAYHIVYSGCRTIADLARAAGIGPAHLAGALQYPPQWVD